MVFPLLILPALPGYFKDSRSGENFPTTNCTDFHKFQQQIRDRILAVSLKIPPRVGGTRKLCLRVLYHWQICLIGMLISITGLRPNVAPAGCFFFQHPVKVRPQMSPFVPGGEQSPPILKNAKNGKVAVV